MCSSKYGLMSTHKRCIYLYKFRKWKKMVVKLVGKIFSQEEGNNEGVNAGGRKKVCKWGKGASLI